MDIQRFFISSIAIAALLSSPALAADESKNPGFVRTDTGCLIYDSDIQAGDRIKWEGKCDAGYASGRGVATFTYLDEDTGEPRRMVFDAEYRSGKLNGPAEVQGDRGYRFTGTYRDHKLEGMATYVMDSGYRFQGFFKGNKRNGPGQDTWPNGEHFEGMYREGKRHGHGVYTSAEGHRYEGPYSEGKRHGQGVLFMANGDRYEGGFVEGKRQGQAILYYDDGERYEGDFRNNVRHGYGKYFYPSGAKYEGQYHNDKRHGQGTFHYANGNRYEGQYQNGRHKGFGRYFYANGEMWEGEWDRSKFLSGKKYSAAEMRNRPGGTNNYGRALADFKLLNLNCPWTPSVPTFAITQEEFDAIRAKAEERQACVTKQVRGNIERLKSLVVDDLDGSWNDALDGRPWKVSAGCACTEQVAKLYSDMNFTASMINEDNRVFAQRMAKYYRQFPDRAPAGTYRQQREKYAKYENYSDIQLLQTLRYNDREQLKIYKARKKFRKALGLL